MLARWNVLIGRMNDDSGYQSKSRIIGMLMCSIQHIQYTGTFYSIALNTIGCATVSIVCACVCVCVNRK